jgi:hypothetical protein
MSKTLSRRLERLEEEMMPTDNPTVRQIVCVDSAGIGRMAPNLKFLRTSPRTTAGEARVEDDNEYCQDTK